MEMTVKEAASVLSTVVSNFQAAKRLEEALRIAVSTEQTVREKTVALSILGTQIIEKHNELEFLSKEVMIFKRKKASASEEASRIAREAQVKEEIYLEAIVKRNKDAEDKIKLMDAERLVRIKSLEEAIEVKERDLSLIEDRLQTAKNDLAAFKERLG